MPITDIALPLRHGMLYKKSVASVTKMLDQYKPGSRDREVVREIPERHETVETGLGRHHANL